MKSEIVLADLDRLTTVLRDCGPAAIAVSGGVDSLTLAFVAHRVLDGEVMMFHATSPAVAFSGTARVKRYAKSEGWKLQVIDAGEFDDERYMANPANRCFYCKTNLYGAIAAKTGRRLLSGTNLDDLSDWRPGLKAAAEHAVRHPFVEAEITKAAVRAMAHHYGLTDIAELPASPCLSSRVETGIRIVPEALRLIDGTERLIQRLLNPKTVRCRIRSQGLVVELDEECYAHFDDEQRAMVLGELDRLGVSQTTGASAAIAFVPYVRGSAFLRKDA
jgi:uncharacterized protein